MTDSNITQLRGYALGISDFWKALGCTYDVKTDVTRFDPSYERSVNEVLRETIRNDSPLRGVGVELEPV